ncbi:unnamed protein product [Effrenium voratum]|uniref:Major facilitator superfamily (MFS) profile domain-containing protein n=1 Tax=Effrenium voratum TaxID=2562239 RepID=A0AA36I3M2_9DINO|nr:unnamed protein product [Effrenium voratum]
MASHQPVAVDSGSAKAASDNQQWSDAADTKKQPQESWWSWLLQMACLNMVMVMWNTDNMALPAVYTEIAKHFNLSPADLSNLGLVRGIFESVFALPAGFLADRLPRPQLILAGSMIWAVGLIGCAFSPDLLCMTIFRAVNGIGLGIVQPLLFSLVADKSGIYGRGKAFGCLIFTGQLGQTAFTAFATTVASTQVGSIAGWQFALLVIAIVSAFVGVAVGIFVKETKERDQRTMLAIIIQETPKLSKIFCLPTFLVIIGQGVFGTAPWFAFSYLTMWLELNCFSNQQAATIYAFFNIGTAFSSIIGGFLLDMVFRRCPDHGPPTICQFSVGASIPLFAFILFGLGDMDIDTPGLFGSYCAAFLVTGILIAWNMVMNNKMFSDVVPRESYSYIYALDRCIEGTFGAFGQPAVGWLTDKIFGFDSESANQKECSPQDAHSLASGVFWVSLVSFAMCFLFYCLAHCTYPKDRRAVALAQEKLEMQGVM